MSLNPCLNIARATRITGEAHIGYFSTATGLGLWNVTGLKGAKLGIDAVTSRARPD